MRSKVADGMEEKTSEVRSLIELADESDLWERRDTDPQAREELIRRYLGYAKSIAVRFRSQAEALDDLVQVASLGLMSAVSRFDPDRGIPFIAFAAPTITGELKRHFRDRTSTVRLPRSLYDRIGRIENSVGDLTSRLNRDPSITEVAAETGCSEREVSEAVEAGHNRHPVSLDQGLAGNDDEGVSPAVWLGEEDHEFETAESRIMLRDAMSDLSAEERMVIRLRFRDELTQSEIAERIGHSQMHVSRMLRRILNRLGDRLPAAA